MLLQSIGASLTIKMLITAQKYLVTIHFLQGSLRNFVELSLGIGTKFVEDTLLYAKVKPTHSLLIVLVTKVATKHHFEG